MKTDELKISQNPQKVQQILDKIEYIALYTGMSRRDASNVRLLSEELLTATKGILNNYDGRLWMETNEKKFSLHLRVSKPRGKSKRDNLIALSKTGKATMPKGLFARLSVSLENYLRDDDIEAAAAFTDYSVYTGDMCGFGSLYAFQYIPVPNVAVTPEKEEKPVDELAGIEKNIINAIVDDIVVTLQKDSVEIIAVKNL